MCLVKESDAIIFVLETRKLLVLSVTAFDEIRFLTQE